MSVPEDPPPNPNLDALLAEAGWVLKLAKRLARDQAAAEDIAQSTLVLALEKRPALEGGLRPWLAAVASRLARHRTRSDARRQAREASLISNRGSESNASDDVLMRFELQQDLARRVDALPKLYRRVLIYRYYEGLSVGEIAKLTSATPSTIRSQLARGIERLRLQYNGDSKSRGALGTFLVAAGSSTDFISRRTAEFVIMQTSTKVVAATVVTLAISVTLAVNWSDPDHRESNGPNRVSPGGESAQAVLDDLAPIQSDTHSSANAPTEESAPMASERTEIVADTIKPTPVEIPQSTVTTLRVRVLGPDQRPLAGATLSSIYPDGRARGTHNIARSDYEGRIVLELTDDSMRMSRDRVLDMTFAVGAAEHATKFVIKQPRFHGETDLGDIRLDLGCALTGVSVDADGRPIAGAILSMGATVITGDLETLRLSGPEPDDMRPRTISAADGTFELGGISARLAGNTNARLWAHAPGHLWTITETIGIMPGERIDVGRVVLEEVPQDLRIEGTVLRPDGLPAAGARVDFSSMGRPMVGHVLADEQGDFLVMPRDDATIELLAHDSAGDFGMSPAKMAKRGSEVELRLMPRRVIPVNVIDEDGEPVVDAHFRPLLVDDFSPSNDDRLVLGKDWKYTDEEGRSEVEVPGQSFLVWARKTGFGSVKVGPFERSSAPNVITIKMPRGREVTGRVFAYGQPVEGARVSASRRYESFVAMTGGFPNRYPDVIHTVSTDADGHFAAPLKLDWSELGVLAKLEGWATGEVTLDVPRGEDVHDVEIHLTHGGAIEGGVIPPPGMEDAGLFVAASRGDGSPISTRVNAEGRYRFEGLTPGNWRVEGRLGAARTELLSTSQHPDDMEPGWNAVVVDRKTLELDVDMSHLGDVEVRGQLLIDGVAPLPGWVVEVVRPRHARGPTAAPVSPLDGEGRFTFNARPGRVELRLVGSLAGGAMVEVLREVHLQGPRFDWEGMLTTLPVVEWLEGNPERARFVRGMEKLGDRELSIVPVGENGVLSARVPVGRSSLQIAVKDASLGSTWATVRMVNVE